MYVENPIVFCVVLIGMFVLCMVVFFIAGARWYAHNVPHTRILTTTTHDDSDHAEEEKPEEPELQTFFVSVETTITDKDGNIVAEDEKEFSFEA